MQPLGTGVLRASPEDFEVDEILGFDASGEGPHALLRVRKRGANTEWVARELARAAGVQALRGGFRRTQGPQRGDHAALHRAARQTRRRRNSPGLTGEGFEVLAPRAHQRKLPRGALEGNRFVIVVRDFACDAGATARNACPIAAGGVPNYFGQQRFGREAAISSRCCAGAAAAERAAGSRVGRDDAGFMLSAARSVIFNAMLAERVAKGTWNRLLPGMSPISMAAAACSRWTPRMPNWSSAAPRSTCIPPRH